MSRSQRAAKLIVASVIAVALVVTWPAAAAAQNGLLGRVARLPFDLLSKILTNDPAPVNVIVEVPQDVVDSLAQTYDVTIVKRLYFGRGDLGHAGPARTPWRTTARIASMAVDRPVAATQTVDTQATGANQVWPGLLEVRLQRRRRRRRRHRLWHRVASRSQRPRLLLVRPRRPEQWRPRLVRPRHARRGHHRRQRRRPASSRTGRSGPAWRRARSLINVRVLGNDGSGVDLGRRRRPSTGASEQQSRFNIRVINLSLGHLPVEAPEDDPLVLAVNRAVAAGIVVVTSAGNFGKLPDGTPVVGGDRHAGHRGDAPSRSAPSTRAVRRSDRTT